VVQVGEKYSEVEVWQAGHERRGGFHTREDVIKACRRRPGLPIYNPHDSRCNAAVLKSGAGHSEKRLQLLCQRTHQSWCQRTWAARRDEVGVGDLCGEPIGDLRRAHWGCDDRFEPATRIRVNCTATALNLTDGSV
jgi:hypothetical protein